MPSDNGYYKEYRRAERLVKKGERENMIDLNYQIKFKSKTITVDQFSKYYKTKIKNKEQQLIFNNCLDLIDLINSSKECLESEGTYIKNATGTLKVNPGQKELRENLKAFNSQLQLLHTLLSQTPNETTLEGWLDD